MFPPSFPPPAPAFQPLHQRRFLHRAMAVSLFLTSGREGSGGSGLDDFPHRPLPNFFNYVQCSSQIHTFKSAPRRQVGPTSPSVISGLRQHSALPTEGGVPALHPQGDHEGSDAGPALPTHNVKWGGAIRGGFFTNGLREHNFFIVTHIRFVPESCFLVYYSQFFSPPGNTFFSRFHWLCEVTQKKPK